jgi:MFS-type transporter involved in bile tolerance (Atg22 family)
VTSAKEIDRTLPWFVTSGRQNANDMSSDRIIPVLYVLAMVALIVGVDFAFLRDRFGLRLIVNIGIVLVFAAVYLRFLWHR